VIDYADFLIPAAARCLTVGNAAAVSAHKTCVATQAAFADNRKANTLRKLNSPI
jgi:hypothetical protein